MAKRLEEKIIERTYSILKSKLSEIIKPTFRIGKVTELTKEQIIEIKQEFGIEGIILDIDGTVRKDMGKLPKANEEWIETIKKELPVIVVSNGIDGQMEEFLKAKDIGYIAFAHKPLKSGFQKACNKLGVKPEKMLVIGDDIWTDIYGGKRNNMKTVLVDKVEER
ncbi:MAG: HAD-IA family hydrolase [Lachnospiraceae bacterium]|jgi:HAD superfamily phosphatase (TIGR01668 family)|nr:HAD-IA family hydrolase [Lachnospiraceae bacterium]